MTWRTSEPLTELWKSMESERDALLKRAIAAEQERDRLRRELEALVVGAIACPTCAEWAASMDKWAHTALAEAHDALRLLTPDSTMMEFAETVRITCALEFANQHGCTSAAYLAERAAHDCLYGTTLTPRIQEIVRQACLDQMCRLFAGELAEVVF